MKSFSSRHAVAIAATLIVGSIASLVPAAEAAVSPLGASPLALAMTDVAATPSIEFNGVHYRPRRDRDWGRHADASSVSQIHIGFFDPDGDPTRQFLVGIRGGPMLDSHLQLGLGVDWAHKTENISSVQRTSTGPNGLPITVKEDLARASTNFFPIMAFVQYSADDDLPVIPYFGAAGGYQVLNLTADDFVTNASFDATYGGWGWQIWGGGSLPLSGRTRLNGEVFVNGGEMGRDVTDDTTGLTYRETVSADGAGLRLGVAWGF